MSLPRHSYNIADKKLSIALNRITEDKINTSIKSAAWSLEVIIRNFKPEEHQAISSIEKEIERKRLEMQNKYPEEARVFILKGMLLERMNKHEQALASYQKTRMHFQHCWHAYVYPAKLLQHFQRYEESKNILTEMVKVLENAPDAIKPKDKVSMDAKSLQVEAEQKLEEQKQLAEKQMQAALVMEQKRLAKEEKKAQRLEAKHVQQQFEKYTKHPSYNQFAFLSNTENVWDTIKAIDLGDTSSIKNYANLANKHGIFASGKAAEKAPVQKTVPVSHHVATSGKKF